MEFELTLWEKEKLQNVSSEELFLNYNLRGVPEAVNRTMINWAQAKWDLQLLTYIPIPRELLKLQVKKCRCITLITSPLEIDQLVFSARDPLSFVIHDLQHADQFFSHEESLKGQLGFYYLINEIYDRPEIKKSLKENNQFKNEFEYVVSDMNAYVIHLFKSLKSAFAKLDSDLVNPLFPQLINWWDMPTEVHEASRKLNTPEFSHSDEINLKTFFERFQESSL
jgi:hypothetical protein